MTRNELRNACAKVVFETVGSKDSEAAAVYLGLSDIALAIEGLTGAVSKLPAYTLSAGNAIADKLDALKQA